MKIAYELENGICKTQCPHGKIGHMHPSMVKSAFCTVDCGHCKSDNGHEIECDYGEGIKCTKEINSGMR